MAPGMVPQCLERAGVAPGISLELRPFLHQETPGHLQIQTLIQGEGINDIEHWTMVIPVNIACPVAELLDLVWALRTLE